MVRDLRRRGELSDERVAAAMARVPRHVFLPRVDLSEAYADQAVPTHFSNGVPTSAASQPAVVALMLTSLRPPISGSVLEIGAGTGYNAALLGWLVGPSGHVTSVDISSDVAEEARRNLAAAGVDNVEVLCGDGAEGSAARCPYDGIIVTAGVTDLAPAWLEQLGDGGRIVVPLSLSGVQQCVTFARADGHLRSLEVYECGFMPLTGMMANTDGRWAVPGHAGVFVEGASGLCADAEEVALSLDCAHAAVDVRLEASASEIFGSFRRWLAIHADTAGSLTYLGPPEGADDSGIPPVLDFSGEKVAYRSTPFLLERAGLATLDLAMPADEFESGLGAHLHLAVRAFGSGSRAAARLESLLRSWDAAGRPGIGRLRIDAYPSNGVPTEIGGGSVYVSRYTTFVVTSEMTPMAPSLPD